MPGSYPSDDKGRTRMKKRGGETLDLNSGGGGGVVRDVVMVVNIAAVRKHE